MFTLDGETKGVFYSTRHIGTRYIPILHITYIMIRRCAFGLCLYCILQTIATVTTSVQLTHKSLHWPESSVITVDFLSLWEGGCEKDGVSLAMMVFGVGR